MNKQFTALVYKACPCCGKKDEEQSELLIHTRFDDLSKVHNTVTGFGKFCKECQEMCDKSVACVIVDESKTEEKNNPFRTGQIFGLSDDWVQRAIEDPLKKEILKSRMFFMDWKDALALGLPVEYTSK